MKIFMTGATGYLGSALVRELSGAGHRVTGLLRSPEKTDYLADELGGRPAYGDIGVPASYRTLAGTYDALVHVAFDAGGDPVGADRTAIDTLLRAAREGDAPRVVVYTSGCWVLGDTSDAPEAADESASTEDPAAIVAWRPAHERRVLESAATGDGRDGDAGFATAVIRPGLVYGGRGGLISGLFASARREGASAYVEPGTQHWSLIHRQDLARLYRRVLERAAGGIFHGVDGSPLTARETAAAASRAAGAGGATRALSVEEAREGLGGMAGPLALDQRLSAPRSRALGWAPERPSFIEAAETAFREWASSS